MRNNLFLTLLVFLFATLTGCATMKRVDPETGLEVTFKGTAHGAAQLVQVTDPRITALAETAVDGGMSTALTVGDLEFSAEPIYMGYGMPQDGTVSSDGIVVPGRGLVSTSPPMALPLPSYQAAVPGAAGAVSSQATVPCPMNRLVLTVAEQSACNEQHVKALYRSAR